MTEPQQSCLLRIARAALGAELENRPSTQAPPDGVAATLPSVCAGAFVTLRFQSRLRGCMGTFQPEGTLAETIDRVARLAARDPRFAKDPLRPDELGELNVEVSVLSPLQLTAHPERLEIGTHGIVIRRGDASGCFLPIVAVERQWSPEEFLSQCCQMKAGLPADAWKQPGTTVHLFTAESFSN